MTLDIDSSLVEVHSENKQGTGPTYKGGFGFNPMLCTADATGEVLAVRLRPGNAGTTTVVDHLEVLDAALAGLPPVVAVGQSPGDDAALVRRPVTVRADSAGCSSGFVWGARARNVGFAVVARSNAQVSAAISRAVADPGRWSPALRQDGEARPGAAVAELTDLVDLDGWPSGTRLVVRREPLHPAERVPGPGAPLLGPLDRQRRDPVALDVAMRAHARIEDNIRRLRDSGFERFPFVDLDANRAWLAEVCFADALVRGFQLLCCDGTMAAAAPKTLRWALWHSPARVVRRRPLRRAHPGRLAQRRRAPQLLPAHRHAPLTRRPPSAPPPTPVRTRPHAPMNRWRPLPRRLHGLHRDSDVHGMGERATERRPRIGLRPLPVIS